jgi:hypothetical protein
MVFVRGRTHPSGRARSLIRPDRGPGPRPPADPRLHATTARRARPMMDLATSLMSGGKGVYPSSLGVRSSSRCSSSRLDK